MARLTALVVTALLAACDGGGGGDGGGDGGIGDGGSDGALDSGDSAPVGPADCPRNSGWPCTCDRLGSCDDGSPCASLPLVASGLGVCAAPCIPGEPPGSACPPEDFPAPGWCQLRASATGAPTHCLLVCVHSEVCPSDQVCVDPGIEGVPGYCLPE